MEVSFIQIGEKWPPKGHRERLERYATNKKLFLGKHDSVYLEHMMERMDVNHYQNLIQIAANFPGAVTKLYADLLFGEEPTYSTKDDQEWLDNFVERNNLKSKNYKAGLAQSYRGDAIYKLTMKNGNAQVSVVPSRHWFPVTAKDNVNEVKADVIAYTEKIDDKNEKLHVEIHEPGVIEYRTYRVKNGEIKSMINKPNQEQTGVDRSLIFHVPNLQIDDRLFGIDDYSEADSLFTELDTRLSQIAKILDNHSSPNMSGPRKNTELDAQTGQQRVDVGGKYFSVEGDEPEPKYLTWDGKLSANFEFLDRILDMLYIVTDTNAAAFSLFENGSIPSGSAMRRLLTRTIARTSRKRLPFADVLPELIVTANKLEANNIHGVSEIESVSVEFKDGLPNDEVEQAEIMKKRTAGRPTISQESAIKSLDNKTGEELEEEMQRIKEDSARSAPPEVAPTVFGETEEGTEEGGEE